MEADDLFRAVAIIAIVVCAVAWLDRRQARREHNILNGYKDFLRIMNAGIERSP